MLDIVEAADVDVTVDHSGKLWINVDGRCVLRIGHATRVQADDPVRGMDVVYEDDRDSGASVQKRDD